MTNALILSAGSGFRFAADKPKQFALLQGKPVFIHSLLCFLRWPRVKTISLTVPQEHSTESRETIEKFLKAESRRIRLINGKESRHLSCLAGIISILDSCGDEDSILIHDAVRPLVTQAELERLWKSLQNSTYEVASLAAPLVETIVHGRGWLSPIVSPLDRDQFYAVKTPQIAYVHTLKRMIAASRGQSGFTDLLSWASYCGIKGVLVEAGPYNWKITEKRDLLLLQEIIRAEGLTKF